MSPNRRHGGSRYGDGKRSASGEEDLETWQIEEVIEGGVGEAEET